MIGGSRVSLLVALVIGAIATFLVRGVIQNIGSAADRAAMSTTIVVTRAPVAFGAPLGVDNLREVPWRSSDRLEGSFATIADLIKDGRRLALVSLQSNEPVLASRVTAPNERATLSTQIADGMRAVTVRVDEVRGVAGFVLPGDRVDVILTRGEGSSQDAAAYADVLLQNAKVLAVDQLVDERQDKPTVARAVTLELTMAQAQKVVLAQGIGRLSLALLQANGAERSASARITAGDLGVGKVVPDTRVGELEKRLAEMMASADAARAQAEQSAAQRLKELESRLRTELAHEPATTAAIPSPAAAVPPSSVVTVTRNGSKTESYTVAAER